MELESATSATSSNMALKFVSTRLRLRMASTTSVCRNFFIMLNKEVVDTSCTFAKSRMVRVLPSSK
jgi:hypothetical protein